IYIDSINGSWYFNINQHAPYLANKVVCKGNEGCLFYGPIPIPNPEVNND
ncbi:MAG: hypothetical protein RL621_310, partial [Bacteroidota bacterium]